jgi:hypothetical protein
MRFWKLRHFYDEGISAGVRLADVLTSFDGHPALRTVRLTIDRNGKILKVKFKLEESI